jgi:hypothetical protein
MKTQVSHITLRERINEMNERVRLEREVQIPTVKESLIQLYHSINEYFGIAEGTSDVIWWWGFLGFSAFMGTFILIINFVTAGL